jgi:transposase
MDRISAEDLREIEGEVFRRMVHEYGLDLSGLVLDMTNFATFIDSGNDRAPIAQRGRAKQKRVDLRLVGLGLVVTRDGGIPLFSHAYPGDRPDVTQFATMLDELVARYREFTGNVTDLTLVYDAGQNSAANHALVEDSGIGFVGSLPPSDHPALLKLTTRAYRPVDEDRFPGVTCVDTTVTALGVTRRAVLTHSPTLHQAQHRGFDQTLDKARNRLGDLQARLARGNTRKDRTAVEAEIATILRARWTKDVIQVDLVGEKPSDFRLTFRTDQGARARLERRLFGKRILFTNRTAWSTAEVVAAYRSQAGVESGFRQLKDPHVVSFSPLHHWTDQKIRVHVFYCVLALAVAHLMRRQAENAQLKLSVRELLDQLAGIEETVLLYHDGAKGRPRAQRMLTDINPTQRTLADLFDIQRYAPRR